ncbi:hypothetical protein Fmac_011625 [Flemingia macrophylla]|uniref:O-methyltransferase dimerisation domain-containing protein n=1 Tax=Flemingia macrophylla TaxID=520843 RepID=A0ABD1MMZ9_9FABA
MDSNFAEENNACNSAMNHYLRPMYFAALNAAIELNLFEIIAKASPVGVSASDVASELPTQHPELSRTESVEVVVFFVSFNFKETFCDFDMGVFEKVHGVPFYKFMADPALNNIFNKAMANIGRITRYLKHIQDFKEYRR